MILISWGLYTKPTSKVCTKVLDRVDHDLIIQSPHHNVISNGGEPPQLDDVITSWLHQHTNWLHHHATADDVILFMISLFTSHHWSCDKMTSAEHLNKLLTSAFKFSQCTVSYQCLYLYLKKLSHLISLVCPVHNCVKNGKKDKCKNYGFWLLRGNPEYVVNIFVYE